METVRLSVRAVVERIMQSGDIDSRYTDSDTMNRGARAHRKIQKSMGDEYKKEVSLSIETEINGISFLLQGRADGIITNADGNITIDEIKTTVLTFEKIFSQTDLHLGQAKCYAHMLLKSMELPPESITIQLTYFQLDTEEIERQNFKFSASEIEEFFHELIGEYAEWMIFEADWKRLRDDSIKSLQFPYSSYRKGQRDMAAAAYRTIAAHKKLYAEAPTGIGKTMSALFPAIKAISENHTEKLFYLTAKTITRTVAEDAAALLNSNGLRLKSLTIKAKDKICFCDETICNPDYCEFAKGHFDRISTALLDILQNNDLMTSETVEEYAKKHSVCPYEFSLDCSLYADVVICDYNYVFDPVVYLKRFFFDGGGEYTFLIDEAHNLLERVRDMYTVSLNKSDFLMLKRELKDKNENAARLRKAMGDIDKYLLEIRKSYHENKLQGAVVHKEIDSEFVNLIITFEKCAKEWLAGEQHNGHFLEDEVLELYFNANLFLLICEMYDEKYIEITEIYGSAVERTLFCLDPSGICAEKLAFAKSGILFSATLSPLPYYREILGGSENDAMLSLKSPFDERRLLLLSHCGISTKYDDRAKSVEPITDAILSLVRKKRGNYIVYFPSYEYMSQVAGYFSEHNPEINLLIQERTMTEKKRVDFLNKFNADNVETLVGFCVMGGIFSEGIDLKGDRLIGTVIVGVGLPKISLRIDEIKKYYNELNGRGYDYAYVFPGINKVMQSAGRVIRSETDYGVVLLIDTRFQTAKYRSLFPAHWSKMIKIYSNDELKNQLDGFEFFNEGFM